MSTIQGKAMHAEAEITFDCSKCSQHLSVDASGAGQIVQCPTCGEPLSVPQEDILAQIAAITHIAPGWEERERRSKERDHSATEAEVSALREQLVETVRLRSRMEREVMAARTEMESLQSQLRKTVEESNRVATRLEQLESGRRDSEEALSALRAQNEKLMADDAAKDSALAERAETLRETQWALEKSEKRNLALTQEAAALRQEVSRLKERVALVEALESEVAALRTDFAASADAQECNRLRARAEAADEKRRSMAHEMENLETEVTGLREEVKTLRERCSVAEQRVEALSVDKVHRENEVLRGVLARQKTELENCFRELKRFRRSELGLRLVYALFALGLLGVAAFAIQTLPGLADIF